MRQLRLLAFCVFAMLAIGALAAATASAEAVDGPPKVLLLSGKVTELKFTDTSEAASLETTGGTSIADTKSEVTFEEFLESEKSIIDTNLWRGDIHFAGAKQGKIACRSENAKGEKDPVETILLIIDVHVADEKSNMLEPLLEPIAILILLGIADETEATINCAGVKDKVKGRVACLLLPGLKIVATGAHEILCKQSKGKQETGACEETPLLCEELKNDPLLANFGKGFESAALLLHLLGSFGTDIFIDD